MAETTLEVTTTYAVEWTTPLGGPARCDGFPSQVRAAEYAHKLPAACSNVTVLTIDTTRRPVRAEGSTT